MKNSELSAYQIIVVSLYVVFLSLAFRFLNFSFYFPDNLYIAATVVLSMVFFGSALFNIFRIRVEGINKENFSNCLVALAILIISIAEEMIFRGIILEKILKYTGNPLFSVVGSSLFYGLAHLANKSTSLRIKGWNWPLIIGSFLLGIYLGVLYLVTKSLVVPIIIHFLILLFLKFWNVKFPFRDSFQ